MRRPTLSLFVTREEVRAPEAGYGLLHAIDDGAGEVHQFVMQPVVASDVVACCFVFDGAHEVLRQVHGEATQREQRWKNAACFATECFVDLCEGPASEGEVCDLSPREAPAAVGPVCVFVVGSCFALELFARHSEESAGFAEPVRWFAPEEQFANVQCVDRLALLVLRGRSRA